MRNYKLSITDQGINNILKECIDKEEEMGNPFKSYEQGIREGIEWLLGLTKKYPLG